jgi:N-acetylmuramoyl-L-alanine amidase
MKKYASLILCAILSALFLWLQIPVSAKTLPSPEKTTITSVRYKSYPEYTRVVIDCDRPPLYRVDRLIDSHLISIYFSKAMLGESLLDTPILLLQGSLETLETREEGLNDVAVLLTFKNPGKHKFSALTNPNRLVLDVEKLPDETPFDTRSEPPSEPLTPPSVSSPNTPSKPSPPKSPSAPPAFTGTQSSEIHTIIIDPGHGGDDTGAIGKKGLTESEVVLDVSLRVTKLLRDKLRKEVIMTRDTDVFIPLKDRTTLANNRNADLFVSIHANASPRRSAHGIETYLFGRATDAQSLAVAARENATDIKSAQGFQEIILNDLLRDFVLNEALELAHYTQNAFVERLIPRYPTASLGVKKAPFYVLAHTKMPAILAEISFVSNTTEEQRLREASYRQTIAESVFQGIKEYIEAKRN